MSDKTQQRKRGLRRPFYRHGIECVTVSWIRLSSNTLLEPGTRLEGMPRFQMAALYRRRKIGCIHDSWTQHELLGLIRRLASETAHREAEGRSITDQDRDLLGHLMGSYLDIFGDEGEADLQGLDVELTALADKLEGEHSEDEDEAEDHEDHEE